MDKVLIDTDVIMDFFFDRKPFAEYSTDVLNLCAEKQIEGFTTPVIVCNVYYLLRKTAGHNLILEKISRLLQIIDVINMGKAAVLKALNSEFKDFEDALQNFSASEEGRIKIIITRNIKDFKKSNLIVLTPKVYLTSRPGQG